MDEEQEERSYYETVAHDLGFIFEHARAQKMKGWEHGATAILDYLIKHYQEPEEDYYENFEEGRTMFLGKNEFGDEFEDFGDDETLDPWENVED